MFLEILLKVIGIFILVLMGFAAGKSHVVPRQAMHAFNGYLLNFAIPCMLFSFMQVDESTAGMIDSMAGALAAFALVTIILGILSFVIIIPLKLPEKDKGIYRVQVAFTNSGFMAIPLTGAIFGEDMQGIVVMLSAVFSLIMYSFGILLITYEKGKPLFDKRMLRNMINVPIISAVIGCVIFVTGFHFPDFINMSIDLMADTVSPLAMFVVGVNLSFSQMKGMIKRENVLFCFISLAMVPAITLGICYLLPISCKALTAVVFAMAMPSPAIAPVLAARYGGDQIKASEVVAITTIVSLATLPVWAWMLMNYFC